MKKSLFQLHIAIFLASLSAIFGKLISLNEVFLTLYRMLFAAIILLFIDWYITKIKPQQREKHYLWLSDRLRIIAIGALLGLHWILFYASIKYANISVGVVCFCLTGLFTAILAPIIEKKKISWTEVSISLLTLLGIILIFKVETQFRLGIFFGVLSSIVVSLFTILNEPWTKHTEALQLTKYQMIGGTLAILLLLPVYLQIEPIIYRIPNSIDFIYLLLLAGVCTVVLYILLNKAMKFISAFTVNINFNLEPLYAIVIAALFFNEFQEISWPFYVGLFLILSSLLCQVILISRKQNNIKVK